MFGIFKKIRSTVEPSAIQTMNIWQIRGFVSEVTKARKGMRCTVTTTKVLSSGNTKLLHHSVQFPSLMAQEWLDTLEDDMLIQVKGEMHYGSVPYCLAREVEIIC